MRAFYIIFAFLACSAFGAEYEIPSTRLPGSGTWAAAGVPGGIPTRSTIYTTITSTGDTTDRTTEINTALADCPSDQVVLLGPGSFTTLGTIGVGSVSSSGKSNITLRGSVNLDGSPATTIDSRSSSSIAVAVGTGYTYNWPTAGADVTAATLTKGATSITVSSSADFSNGQLVLFQFDNEADTPIFTPLAQTGVRAQIAKIKDSGGKPDGTTIVLDAPGIHGDHTALTGGKVYTSQFKNVGLGVENLVITGINSGGVVQRGVYMETAYGCWVYNCKIEACGSYNISTFGCYRIEVRRCWLDKEDGGSSSGALFTEWTTLLLAIDNVLTGGPVGIFQQQKCSANVFAYNLLVNAGSRISANVNHGAWCEFTLLEGNLGAFYQNDGYWGGSGLTTVFRNWFMGIALDSPTEGYTVAINRYSRYENLVGNVFGKTGIGGGGYSFGNPNIGNGGSSGVTSRRGTLSTLTTRTSDSVGTITAPSGHGVTTGATIDVYWALDFTSYQTSNIRYGMTVGAVSGTSIPVSGGTGAVLPASSAPIFVPTTNSALWEYSADWNSTAQATYEWTGTLTTRSSDSAGVVTLDGGMVTSFNTALAKTATSYPDVRGLKWAAGEIHTLTVTNVTGNDVTFSGANTTLPAISTSVSLIPSYAGFQEQDLDVVLTTLLKANYLGLSSGSGIPAAESIGSDTLANSMFLGGTPTFFTEAGVSWPPVNPNSPNESTYEIIPAGIAYNDGWWPGSGGGGTQATVTGTTTVTGTLTLP